MVRLGCNGHSSACTIASTRCCWCALLPELSMLDGAGLGDNGPDSSQHGLSVGDSVLGMLTQDGGRSPFAVPSVACAIAHSVAGINRVRDSIFHACAAGLVIPTTGCWVVSTQIPLRRQAHDMYERTHQKDSNISFEAHRGRALHVARGRGGNGAGRSAGHGPRGLAHQFQAVRASWEVGVTAHAATSGRSAPPGWRSDSRRTGPQAAAYGRRCCGFHGRHRR